MNPYDLMRKSNPSTRNKNTFSRFLLNLKFAHSFICIKLILINEKQTTKGGNRGKKKRKKKKNWESGKGEKKYLPCRPEQPL